MITLSVAGPRPPQHVKHTGHRQLWAGGRPPRSSTQAPSPLPSPQRAASGHLGLCLCSGDRGARGFMCIFTSNCPPCHCVSLLPHLPPPPLAGPHWLLLQEAGLQELLCSDVFSFQDIDLNHYRIGKIEGFEVLKKVKVRATLSSLLRGC